MPSAPAVPLVSVVVPVYREARNLERLVEELTRVTRSVSGTEFELIFVNDGSTDDSLRVLKGIAGKRPDCKIVDLSRNFGKEIALSAGVHYASGDAVICIDADLQHPPELIPAMVQAWREGAEVVLTVRRASDRKALARRAGAAVFYWIMAKIADRDVVVSNGTDYRLIARGVIEAFNQIGERERMFRGLVDWLGFRRVQLEFDAPARDQGEPGYSYAKLFRLAMSSLVSHSLLPLRFVGYLGFAITVASALLLLWMLIGPFFSPVFYYTPLAKVVVGNTLLIGIVLTALGVMSLYIAKIYAEVLDRPLYAVRQLVNFSLERVRLVEQVKGGGHDRARSRASGR